MQPRIRAGVDGDLPAITEIYNHYVRETPITFDVVPFSVEERRAWLQHFAGNGPHRLFVADSEGCVVGFAYSHSFRPKAAYATSVETTIYLAPGHTGRGIGSRLYGVLFDVLDREDLHRAYAGITLPNPASRALHARFGFREIGVFQEVGRKLGRYWDVVWLERSLG